MSWRILLRLTVSAALTGALLPAAFAQSQENQSVAEAARRAKEQKKTPAKPAKVITEDDVKPATPAASASASTPGAPAAAGAATTPATGAAAGTSQVAPSTTAGASTQAAAANAPSEEAAKDGEKEPKEVADLKAQIKQAVSELDWLQRQLRLDQDALYSKTDYASDKEGMAKVDEEKQQVADKQQDVDALKAKLAELLQSLGIDASAQAPAQAPASAKP